MRIPGPYWLHHALVALGIMAIIWPIAGPAAGALAGQFFYLGREVRDREKLGSWDWPGLAAPVLGNSAAYLAQLLYLKP